MVDSNRLISQHIYIPDDLCPGGKIIRALFCHVLLGTLLVIFLAANFGGEGRCAGEELGPRSRPKVPGGIRAEGMAVREINKHSDIVRDRVSPARDLFIASEAAEDLGGSPAVGKAFPSAIPGEAGQVCS